MNVYVAAINEGLSVVSAPPIRSKKSVFVAGQRRAPHAKKRQQCCLHNKIRPQEIVKDVLARQIAIGNNPAEMSETIQLKQEKFSQQKLRKTQKFPKQQNVTKINQPTARY
jgi:hypothetical protein